MDLKKERYDQFVVKDDDTLLNWMINNLEGSKSKIKATLSGHGVRVNGKNISQFDYKLTPGMKIAISKSKSNGSFKNRYIKIVYEDKDIVVLEKNIGVLSMAAGHSSLNVKTILSVSVGIVIILTALTSLSAWHPEFIYNTIDSMTKIFSSTPKK